MSKVSKKLREKLEKRKKQLKSGGGAEGLILFTEGKKKVRFLPVGEDEDFAIEVTQFYLGAEIKGVISPATFGEKCAIMDMYNRLKNSSNEDDKETANSFKPRKKYLSPAIAYKDEKSKEFDDRGPQLALLTNGLYNELIDWMLDEDYGDFTDVKEGYDVKVKREGKTVTDTEYSLLKGKDSVLPKDLAKKAPFKPEDMVRAIMPTYEETREKIKQFLGLDDSDLDSAKKKKKKSKGDDEVKKKKKKK